MAEIKRSDIIDDDALMAPLVLAKNFEQTEKAIMKVIKAGLEHSKILGSDAARNTTKLKEETEKLTKEQQELAKVQNQIATAVAKNNDEYRKYEAELQKIKKELKDKNSLSEKEALLINQTNASIDKLGQALNKNRQAYASLTTEALRNTKQGKELLKTIQQQDEAHKKLKASMGQHQDEVGHYSKAMEGLDGIMGGVIGRTQTLGSQFKQIFTNGWVLGLAAVAASFVALKAAATAYYDATGEGEEAMKKQQATWDAFFISQRTGWRSLGRTVAESWQEGISTVLRFFSGDDFDRIEAQGQHLEQFKSKLIKQHAQDVVDDANTELEANRKLEISRNKLDFSSEQRLAALRQHNQLREQQLKGDIELAQNDILAWEKRLEMLGRNITFGRKISEMTEEELKATDMKEEEITKLAELQSNLIKVESDASAKRIGLLKLEASLVEDIRKDDVQKAEDASMEEYRLAKQEMDRRIKLVQEEVVRGEETKVEGDKRIHNIQLTMADDLIQAQINGLKKLWGYEELTAEERAEVDKRLYQLKLDLAKAFYDQVQTLPEVEIKPIDVNKVVSMYRFAIDDISGLYQNFSDNRVKQIDAELAAFEKSSNRQIELAGNNEDSRKILELQAEKRREQLEKKRVKEEQRFANYQKAIAGTQALINVYLAATKQATAGDPYTAFARVAAIISALTPFALAITRKDVPQYEIGTDNHPGGLAIVGEKGSELISTNGRLSLSPGMPTMMNLPKGTEVIPHEDTMRMLALAGMGDFKNSSNKPTVIFNSKEIVQAIKEQKFPEPPDYLKIGSDIFEVKKYKDGSRQYIRSKSLNV
jgi:hypothetical protein